MPGHAARLPILALLTVLLSAAEQTAPAASPLTPTAVANGAATGNAAGAGTAAAAAASGSAAADSSGLFAVTPAPPCAEPLCYWSDSLTASRTHIVMINPDIVDTTRGISHITADRADQNGADMGNSQWVLSGHVHADLPQGQLRADSATIRILQSRIVSITAQGGPALFQRPAPNPPAPAGGTASSGAQSKPNLSSVSVRGHADSITYDATGGRVQFSGDSWFTDGCNEMTSQQLTYTMATQTVQAGGAAGASGRVHGSINSTQPGAACAHRP